MKPYFESDGVTLYHGDALDILPTVGNAHAVITDPPYLIGAASAGSLKSKTGTWQDAMNAARWFATWYGMAGAALRHDGLFWTFLNWRTTPVVMKAAIDSGLAVTSMAVWDKCWIGPGGVQGLRPSYEMVALMAQPGASIKDRGVADVLKVPVGSYKPTGHPAEKPEGIVQRLLDISALPPGALVVDPFIGSGTTAVVAAKNGLRCIGIEADERFVEMAANRLSQGVLL